MSAHKEVFIAVRHGRAFVSRHIEESDGSFVWQSAVNEAEIEPEAIAAVKAQGGDLTQDGEYVCPPELAAKTKWDLAEL
jgi:hypothetical protein